MTVLRLSLILAIADLAIGSMRAADVTASTLLSRAQAIRAETLIIALYDYAGLSGRDISRVIETTELAFAQSGIHIVWRHCRGALAVPPGTACEGELQVNEIVVRLQPGGAGFSNDARFFRLGHAIIFADGGYYASVFVPAVRAQAAAFGVAFDLLMGYAVAHEVGHCMLGPGHSYAGLMRGAWNLKDAGEMSRLGLHLTKQQARKAAARLSIAAGIPVLIPLPAPRRKDRRSSRPPP